VRRDSLTGVLQDAGLDLELDLSPAVVQADPDRMHQVVANLLTNAAKFTCGCRESHPPSSRSSHGYDVFADQAGEHGYLRRKVVCRRPKGCGAEYPLVPEPILVAWLTAVAEHDTELRLGGRR
jgi:hypothetical protein